MNIFGRSPENKGVAFLARNNENFIGNGRMFTNTTPLGIDEFSTFNTGIFTCPLSGIYRFDLSVNFDPVAASAELSVLPEIDGTILWSIQPFTASKDNSGLYANTHFFYRLEKGQTYSIYNQLSNPVSINASQTIFSGYLIR